MRFTLDRGDDTPFLGRTSRTPTILRSERLECRQCGSSLAGRQVARSHGAATYRCPCGTRHTVELEGVAIA